MGIDIYARWQGQTPDEITAQCRAGFSVEAVLLRERLPRTLALVEERQRKIYDAGDATIEAVKQCFRDFVALCERKERETEEPVLIVASY